MRVAGPVLTIAAAVAIALLFQPLRQRAQRLANRLVYGDRASPYEVLSEFAEWMAGTYGLDDVLHRMASILASGPARPASTCGSASAPSCGRRDVAGRLRCRARSRSTRATSAPDEAYRAVAVRHGDERMGALAVDKPPNEPLTPTEASLLPSTSRRRPASSCGTSGSPPSSAGDVDELRASRRRLVQAQDDERRKIERNLHDGAQQQLVALTVQLGLLERLARGAGRVRPSRRSCSRRSATRSTTCAISRAASTRRSWPTTGWPSRSMRRRARPRSRRPWTPTGSAAIRQIEAAVYFCALEAIQNVAKYAEATSTVVTLAERDGWLVFEMQDDGRGFDLEHATGAVCRGWPTGSTRSGERSRCGALRARAPACAA